MIGAITGDIVGSVYEWDNIKSKEFLLFTDKCFFTDDSILTIALADTILTGSPYIENLKTFYRWYPQGGYGGSFHKWAQSKHSEPYNSWGNGAAMRISPVGYAFDDLDTVLRKAEKFTAITHNHPEGIKGGQSVAASIFLARTGKTKEEIRHYIETQFGYDLCRHVDDIWIIGRKPGKLSARKCRGRFNRRGHRRIDSKTTGSPQSQKLERIRPDTRWIEGTRDNIGGFSTRSPLAKGVNLSDKNTRRNMAYFSFSLRRCAFA